jgi:16S rRNA (uracil1498-N3)-methyltransferase
VLTGEEAKHLGHVLRAHVGDVFSAIDGTGLKYRAVIQAIDRYTITAVIGATVRLENEPFIQITLAQGVCRPAKMDETVEKGTEIGVSSFIFYYSEKGYSKVKDESPKKLTRLERIARAAAKQSKRSIIPVVAPPIFFQEILNIKRQFDSAFLAMKHPDSKPIESYFANPGSQKKILLVVGPESGLTESEEGACINAGFMPVSLGPRRLRTETAAMIFPALVLSYLGEL